MSRVATERAYFAEHPGGVFDEAWHGQGEHVVYRTEGYDEVLEELKGIMNDHWSEMNADPIALEPNYESYAALCLANMLHIVTARFDGNLVGYYFGIVRPHHHATSCLTCFTDFLYLKKEWRRGSAGYNLIKHARDTLKARGVQKMYIGSAMTPDLGHLLSRLGFKEVERFYAQVFT
jgi:GNAT superfamily N-acetyltransferase